MFLVCYNLQQDKKDGTRSFELARALLGPTAHLELCFATDYVCDGLVITARCPDGFPTFMDHRYYHDHNGKYDIVFYRFKGVTYDQIRAARRHCENIVKEKKYKMSLMMMMSSTFPKQFSFLYKWATGMLFGELDEFQFDPPPPFLPIYCVPLTVMVLNELFSKANLPLDCNATDLVIHLLRLDLIEISIQRPDRRHDAEEGTNFIQRAQTEDYIL
jgi:hypothetical protein